MIETYGDARQFMGRMNPSLDTYAAQAWERAYLGQAPTLACVAAGYGVAVAEVWLCLEIENINTFTAARVKLDVEQQRCLARMILAEYGYLKTSEVLLFVHRFKCGRYRQFYGVVDAQVILASLLDFMGERRQERAALFDQQQKERLEQARRPDPNAISRVEYERRKQERERNLSNSNLNSTSKKQDYENNNTY